MGIPQILVIIWCVIGFFWKLVLMAKHGEQQGVSISVGMLTVILHLLLTALFQVLLIAGGFYE